MENQSITIGQAIDQIIDALTKLDEKARLTAITVACEQMEVNIGQSDRKIVEKQSNAQQSIVVIRPEETPRKIMDIRTLKEEKKPNSAKQMACIVAYYLKELAAPEDRKDTISAADLEKYFKQAQYPLPKQMNNVLVKAKMSGYFEDAEKGEYKLNAVGYNLVVHSMPE